MPLTKVASSMLASGASGSGGSTGKNYISSYNGNPCNGDFESGSISGWSVFSVSSITNGLPSGTPTTIAGGGSNPDITLVSPGSQLAGQYSLQASFPISTSANKGFITEVFTIDAQDRAQVLTFGFHYQLTSSASNVNFSGTSSNTFIVSVYAVDGSNAGWIQPAGVYGMTQSSGAGFATGTFQTYSDTTQYRFAILCFNNPTTTSATVTFDDFSVGPTVVVNGTPVTDWQSYTPTLKGTSADPNIGAGSIVGRWRRVGDSLQVQCEATAGAGAASGTGSYYFTLPTGLVIDTARIALVSGSETITSLGSASIFNSSVASAVGFPIVLSGITNGLGISNGGSAIGRDTPAATWWSSGDGLQINAQVPIVGWSSNVQVSSDTDTRVVVMGAYGATTSVNNSGVTVIYPTVRMDSHGAYNASTGVYTVPVSGYYRVSGGFTTLPAAWVNNNALQMSASITGAGAPGGTFAFTRIISAGTTEQGMSGSATYYCAAGDTIALRVLSGQTVALNGGTNNFVSIERLSGPSVVAASESVNLQSFNTAGTVIAAGSTATTNIPFATKQFDSHNAWSTDTFTAPISGKYLVACSMEGAGTNVQMILYAYRDGVQYCGLNMATGPVNGANASAGSALIPLNAGQTISIRVGTSVTGGSITLQTASGRNHVNFVRVGN